MMGKKSRKKMTELTEGQRIEKGKKKVKEIRQAETEKAKELARLILYKIQRDAQAREQLIKVLKEAAKGESAED